jgi:hypothetical protein
MPENELTRADAEREIARDGIDAYVAKRRAIFVPRVPRTGRPVVDASGERLLRETAGWLREAGARVEVVVSPLYDQVALAERDRRILEEVFGADHVHDFSGVNDLTRDARNYYETSHYRPPVGAEILRRIYGAKPGEGSDGAPGPRP